MMFVGKSIEKLDDPQDTTHGDFFFDNTQHDGVVFNDSTNI